MKMKILLKDKMKLNVLLLILILFVISFNNSTSHNYVAKRKGYHEAINENGSMYMNAPSVFRDIQINTQPPSNSIPGLKSYIDYATNGNSLNQLIRNGDTIIALVTYCDSLSVVNYTDTSIRIKYNVSYNMGYVWESYTSGFRMSINECSRFPDGYLMTITGARTVNTTGRYWTGIPNTSKYGGTSHDVLLGIGYPTVTQLQSGRAFDLFSTLLPNNEIGCITKTPIPTPPTTDTVWFLTFNPETHIFSQRTIINTISLDNIISSYTINASPTGNHITSAYCYINEPGNGGSNWRSIRVQSSTDNGISWSIVKKYGFNQSTPGVLGGDSCQAYWHEDIEYKPTTQTPYIVYSTYPYVWNGSGTGIAVEERKGWKIMIQSPDLNNENLVVIADWHNIEILGQDSIYSQITDFQANSALLSHPSIGFSTDGSIIYVAYSVIQKEVCQPPALPFNYFDVYYSVSTNGGLNWGTPVNVTNTPDADEMYPVVLSQKNSTIYPLIAYNWTAIPGSQVFIDQQIISPVYYCLSFTYIPPPGVKRINETANNFELRQNYPNPFNPFTKIHFSVPPYKGGEGNVSLKVFDILGREVATLINEKLKPDSYEVEWNGTNYPSGIYFYTLISGNYSETKKMILLK